jgi:hypothetical protein
MVEPWSSRLIAVGPLLGAATAYRIGVGYLTSWYERTPELVDLWLDAWGPTADAPQAATTFHKRFIEAADKSAQLVADEFKRGLEEVDYWTRPIEPRAEPSAEGD